MLITRIALGRREEVTHPDALKAALAELISTFIFTFAAQGSAITSEKLADGAPTALAGLLVAALSHAFALFAAVSVSANISGGHVNPAVTLGAFIGGNLSLVRVLLYWLAQLLGSTFACLFLKLMTGLDAASFLVSNGVGSGTAMVFELVMTFGLVYTVYATSFDPRKGAIGAVAPIAIGLVVGANILAGGAFTGAAMNPALAFGPALVGWRWADQWVYWLGPLLGAAAASFVYLFFVMSPQGHAHEHIAVGPDY